MSIESGSTKRRTLRSSRSSNSSSLKGDGALSESRSYAERLVRRMVEHVAYKEAVRSEPKIIECLELYQQDLWDSENASTSSGNVSNTSGKGNNHLAAAVEERASTRREKSEKQQSNGRGTKKKTSSSRKSASKSDKNDGSHASVNGKKEKDGGRASTKGSSKNAKHSGLYDLSALMKEAKTLQQFETTGKKPKKSKKGSRHQQRPDTVDGSMSSFRERSASVAHVHQDEGNHGNGSGSGKRNWSKVRRMSVPSTRSDYRAARYNSSSTQGGNLGQPSYPFPNPNIFSLAGCGSNQLLQRVLYLACQQNESIKYEKKVRKERERTSQMPVLASSVHIQLLCAKATAKEKISNEKSWNSYF